MKEIEAILPSWKVFFEGGREIRGVPLRPRIELPSGVLPRGGRTRAFIPSTESTPPTPSSRQPRASPSSTPFQTTA